MGSIDRTYQWLALIVLSSFVIITSVSAVVYVLSNKISKSQSSGRGSDVHNENDRRIRIVWCTINREEQQKCLSFSWANDRDRIRVGYDYFRIECYYARDKDECMSLLDQEKATLTTLDAGQVFIGGRYNSLVPIAQEVVEGGFKNYYAVAVVKKNTLQDVTHIRDLRDKRVCFAGVDTFAGWVLPIYTLMKDGGMDIVDCNNHVKSATKFFGPSCAVNSLTDKFNPIGDNSDKLCQLCIGKIPGGRCTSSDPYAGYEGAFRCLLEVGEVAFLKHTTIRELVGGNEFTGISPDSFELLCRDGSRRPTSEHLECNWGKVPSNAVVTTSASSFELRKKYQLFLQRAAERYNYNLIKNRTTYTSQPGSPYDSPQQQPSNPEYDQFGNRVNRYKRQNFGNFGTAQDRPPLYEQDNINNNNNNNNNNNQDGGDNRYDPNNNPYGQQQGQGSQFGNTDQYGRENDNTYNRNNQYDNTERNRQPNYSNNPLNPNAPPPPQQQQPDLFGRDPYTINRERFGLNIDPYVDGSYNRNRNNQYPISGFNNSLQDNDPVWFNNYNFTNNATFYEVFSLFESSPRYGIRSNLLFQDSTRSIAPVSESQQTYSSFLGESMDVVMGIRDCQVNRMTLCVTSDAEKDKCVKMRTALKAQLLKPEMDCFKGHSQIHCMQAIRSGTADVTVLDASDVYTAGLNYDLVPFISEVYNLDEPEYYVVAVAKVNDPVTDITYLKGKNTCHGGINTAAGWVYPLAFLISNGWIRPYGCNSIRAAAEYFSKSCVPGAISTEYNTGVPYDNMCDLCHGVSFRYCRRDAAEDYYGHTGAFRCLVEGGGDVAFVKHTTVTENTGGKREEWWARDNLNDDFQLLCPDGTRAEIHQYARCNLGKVKANAIVTRGGYGYNHTHVGAFVNLFLYAQTFYGRKTTDEFSFSMFSSEPPYTDLIFQDATTQLKVIEPAKRYYGAYLGNDFLRARRIVDCHAGSGMQSASIVFTLIVTCMAIFVIRL